VPAPVCWCTSYVYDEAGNLLGQYDNGGATGTGQQEVIWLPIENDPAIPVGLYHRGQLHAIHTDQLGTPRLFDSMPRLSAQG
jgi:hypothetical protein